jgi:GNAT superfamily N-acetyltransferase
MSGQGRGARRRRPPDAIFPPQTRFQFEYLGKRNMMDTKHPEDTVVAIDAGNVGSFLQHLLRLDPQARLQRFCHAASDADVRSYVGRLDLKRARVIGFVCEGAMRGAAELSPGGGRGLVFDATVSVERAWQERGIATALLLRAIAVARGLGVGHIRVEGLADNPHLRDAVAQFDIDMLFEDDDCQAWLPVGGADHAVSLHEPASAVAPG